MKPKMNREQFIESFEEELVRRINEQDLGDLKVVLSTTEGRRFVWKLLDKAGVFRTCMTGNSQMYFLEGEKTIGYLIFNMIFENMPEDLLKMQKEYKEWADFWLTIAENRAQITEEGD